MAQPASDSPTLFVVQRKPDFSLEQQAIKLGQLPVAGLDEAGRGPLAGPVVAAAVILDPDRIPAGLDDSKRLTAAARAALFIEIMATAKSMSIASISSASIDASDIRKASLEAMSRALTGLCTAPLLALVDGRDIPPGISCAGRAVIKGDQISASIAAASILAKVTRDRIMSRCGAVDQRYGYERHMGYGTAAHRGAIEVHGPVKRMHRMSFAPMRFRDATS